jgi:Domain of unknown function (DUF1835)
MGADALAPVHVTNGDSVAHTLAQTDLDGSVIAWHDVLHEGPVPPGDPATVRRARAAFLAGADDGSAAAILADLEAVDRALMTALDEGRETVLWFEHDLHDQLQLVQILALVADHPRREVLRMIAIDRFPGHARFFGLGQLSAEELVTLWPHRSPLDPGVFDIATRAYDALRQPDPRRLLAITHDPLPGLPYLAAAIRRLLEERPWAGPGPGRSERQILRAVAEGARTPAEVFAATQAMEQAPYSGDDWIFSRIDELAAGDRPLLSSRAGRLELTPAGQAVLDE